MTVSIRRHTGARSIWAEANPVRILVRLWRQRQLVGQMTWREVTGRYRSSMLGFAWSFVTPLVSLTVYTAVFGVIFKARWPGSPTGNLAEFGLMLFAGLTAFTFFSECVGRAPSLIAANPNFVRKVVFPLEILPVTVMGAALFHAGVSVALLAVAELVVLGRVPGTIAYVPVVFVPLSLLALGLGWALASLGVYFRDIDHTVAVVMQVLFFATPIFYSRDVVPPALRAWLDWNPLAPIMENMRRVAVAGVAPDWPALGTSCLVGLVAFSLGHTWFAKTKRGFADVL
jgi:lipopolysaccharide transport system permease protein